MPPFFDKEQANQRARSPYALRVAATRNLFSTVAKAIELSLQTPRLLLQRDSIRYYEYLGDDVVEGEHAGFRDPNRALWLNLGYWRSARTYPEAAAALACLLADAAQLSPDDTLLDVGFGFAEQDLLWVERYGVARIVGLNITPLHVERAQARVRERGLEGRIDLRLGSATDLPFEPESFDKVTALECAHHFDTREQFFAQAFRALRPGGRLALTDGLPLPGTGKPGFVARMTLRRWAYPVANYYDRDAYCQKLRAAGFVDVQARSIRRDVFPGLSRYAELRRAGVAIADARVELDAEAVAAGLATWEWLGIADYVLFSAEKPR